MGIKYVQSIEDRQEATLKAKSEPIDVHRSWTEQPRGVAFLPTLRDPGQPTRAGEKLEAC
jgi:hypothetical protein